MLSTQASPVRRAGLVVTVGQWPPVWLDSSDPKKDQHPLVCAFPVGIKEGHDANHIMNRTQK